MTPDVQAVLVGVETYAAGWSLDGPANDACRMAAWLLARGVPADRITLAVTPLERNRAAVEQLGVKIVPADQASVFELFAEELRHSSSDLLLVLWGGHGVVDGEGDMRLFYADASTHNKRNADFSSLLAALRSTYYPGHPRQVFLVDACQTLAEEHGYRTSLPGQTFAKGAFVYGRHQEVLFAASVGEAAANDDVRRSGVFSAAVMDWLRENEPPFPLDLAELARAMDRRFSDMRANGRVNQAPSYLRLKTPTHDEVVYSLGAAAPQSLSLRAVLAIVEQMEQLPELLDDRNRQRMILMMAPAIRRAVRYSDFHRTHMVEWIRACEAYATGRTALLDTWRLNVLPERLGPLLAVVDREWPEPSG
ncbi:caspase family protein [Catellatospora sichuanensis]|uniref:caspase family protein n=1 Tax=Catellatospora sichuanensis TaxID=1969805 RepID=UPI001183D715|nr:caspase family protein [Catellatospora sichuanensis]